MHGKNNNRATQQRIILGCVAISYRQRKAYRKLLNGYQDVSFKPDNIITRAEVIAVLNRITQNDNSEDAAHFKDMDESHWA